MDTYTLSMFPIYLAVLIFFWAGVSDFIRISCTYKNPETLTKENKKKIPRITIACIACMYLHLLAEILRLFFFYDTLRYGGQIIDFICMFMVICILSGLNLMIIHTLCKIGITGQVKNSWIALKLVFPPFLILNAWLFDNVLSYIESEVIGYAMLLIIFLPLYLLLLFLIPIIFPLAINVVSGCVGISYICQLRKQTANKHRPSGCHFILQMIPGLDLLSLLFILIKYRESKLGTKVSVTDSVTLSPMSVVQSSYTLQSTHTAQSPYATSAAPDTAPTIFNKIKKHGKVFFLLYLLYGSLLYFKSDIKEFIDEVYEEITAEETNFYAMTDEEIALMKKLLFNQNLDKIEAGQLTVSQADDLERVRFVCQYLETMYPEEGFHITQLHYCYHNLYTNRPRELFYVFTVASAESEEETYQLELHIEPTLIITDQLYAHFQNDLYIQYIEEQIAEEIPGFAKANIYDWHLSEYKNPTDLTAEAISSGTYYAGPEEVYIHIAANGKTSDECKQQQKALKTLLRRIELPVECYRVYYYDMTVEELSACSPALKDAISFAWIYPEDSQ